jgi:small conductance mechanosensitive channel
MADTALNIALTPSKWERALERMWDTAITLGTDYGLRTLGAIAIVFIGYFCARMLKSALIRAGRRSAHLDMTVVSFVASLAKYLILAFTLVAMLSSFGVQTASVVAVIGAAGLAIGLALQGTLGHVASGFMLILFRPFRVGDVIETAGVTGTVTEVSLFTTEITGPDNIRIIIPNSSVWSGVTKNLTSNPIRRADMEITLHPTSDVEKALSVIQEEAAKDTRILKDPPPTIGVLKVNETGVKIAVQVWTKVPDMASVQFDLLRHVLAAFAEGGIQLQSTPLVARPPSNAPAPPR